MKSNYPNQIDTNKEIPVVRDNITEISSDVINSLRSAIINIEKTPSYRTTTTMRTWVQKKSNQIVIETEIENERRRRSTRKRRRKRSIIHQP